MTDSAVDATEYRIEHDTMGEVRVPKNALWRAQTQRAVENFPISFRPLERTQIRALGLLKGACAQVNKDLGLLDAEKADAIIAAAAEIADGQHDDQFPIDVFQTGSGTSSNMNANEVIASIAAANGVTVHPNDHVNMSQSSNDTFPTATHIAATEAAVRHLIPALEVLHESLAGKARQWRTTVKSGRTHLMDAVPVTLGQEFSGYARQVEAGIERVRATLPRLGELAIGGTAVGTGLNAPDGFGAKVVEVLVDQTGSWLATPPPITPRSTVGAGDSSLAGYLRAEVGGAPPPQRLRMAVAYGSAAAALPGSALPTPAQINLDAGRGYALTRSQAPA